MPATATISISGMIVVQLMASRAVARSICQKPSAAQSSRKETRDPQARAMRMARLPPQKVGGKADGRREQDADEEQGGEKHRDLVGIEVPPMEPDRQVWEGAAHHQKQRGIEKPEPPGEGGERDARFRRLGHGG